jgi:hypothetical protein
MTRGAVVGTNPQALFRVALTARRCAAGTPSDMTGLPLLAENAGMASGIRRATVKKLSHDFFTGIISAE